MRNHNRHFVAFELLGAVCLLAIGCQDGRKLVSAAPTALATFTTPMTLQAAAELQYRQAGSAVDTQTFQMLIKGNSLFLTGKPFGFARWEIDSPENPTPTFAAADRLTSFTPRGSWYVDRYAQNALGILGNYAFMSGTFGMSAVYLGETNLPVEKMRYPEGTASSETYKYTAILSHPTLPVFYGFRASDYVLTWGVSTSGLNLLDKGTYSTGGSTVCCAKGGTVFNGRAYVAFQNRLAYYDFDSQGRLVNPGEFRGLNVTFAASTQRYLYLFHEPTYTNGAATASKGLYVFDQSGKNVAYFGMNTPRAMAVGPDDIHLYANFDDTSIQILRMVWTNQ